MSSTSHTYVTEEMLSVLVLSLPDSYTVQYTRIDRDTHQRLSGARLLVNLVDTRSSPTSRCQSRTLCRAVSWCSELINVRCVASLEQRVMYREGLDVPDVGPLELGLVGRRAVGRAVDRLWLMT